jgi:hypothetical protein
LPVTYEQEQQSRDHVRRPPLPWRPDERITECGRLEKDVKTVIEPDQLAWRVKNWGQQRTAFTVCMTCADRARYSPLWEVDPVALIEREARRTGGSINTKGRREDPRRELLSHELRAMIRLVEEHREEFDALVQGSVQSAEFARRRAEMEANRRRTT